MLNQSENKFTVIPYCARQDWNEICSVIYCFFEPRAYFDPCK